MKIKNSIYKFGWLLMLSMLFSHASSSVQVNESATKNSNTYVARQDSLRNFFAAISAHLGKPIIVSKLSSAKQISGEFNLGDADIVNKLCRQLGLVNYSDGYAIYIYDASESKNSVLTLKNISTKSLLTFLKKSGLIDSRYPLRSDGVDTFYLAGPPIYVDLVIRTAEFMDIQSQDQEKYRVEIIKLNNTFVTDRSYTRRDENILIPGIANVIEKLLVGEVTQASSVVKKTNSGSSYLETAIDKKIDVSEMAKLVQSENTEKKQAPSQIRIIAYPETNSLLVKGSTDQIRFVRNLVEALDEEKRHVELALWIIDLEKDDLDQLGVSWQGAISKGKLSLSINADSTLNSFSTLEGGKFLASILALTRKNKAQIVSRPVVLTQENTPAMFDNNRTFYTPLISERAVDLQKVTYGTMVHVLPRFTIKDEIELSLNIEDGNEMPRTDANSSKGLPTVGRTKISTVARVPKGKSLLVGGYTRGETGEHLGKIPLLGDLPFIGGAFRYNQTSSKNTVRVFLIRPREITDGFDLDSENISDAIGEETLIKNMDKTREMMLQREGGVMAANISSSGLALAATNLILEWRKKTQKTYRDHKTQNNQKVQLQQVEEKTKSDISTRSIKNSVDGGENLNSLNQRLLDMADDMAYIANQFRSQRQANRKNSNFNENFDRVLEDDIAQKAKKLVELSAVKDLTVDDLMMQARTIFLDESDLYLVLKEIISRNNLNSQQSKRLESLQKYLVRETDQKKLKAGINCALKARLFGSTIGLNATLLRQTYRRFLESDQMPLAVYQEWVATYGYKLRHTVLDFIEESLSTDIRSEDPSCNHIEFGYLLGNMIKLQILRTADREFIMYLKSRKLVTPSMEGEVQWLVLLFNLVDQKSDKKEILRRFVSDCILENYAARSTLINSVFTAYKRLPENLFEIDYDKDCIVMAFDELLDHSYNDEILIKQF